MKVPFGVLAFSEVHDLHDSCMKQPCGRGVGSVLRCPRCTLQEDPAGGSENINGESIKLRFPLNAVNWTVHLRRGTECVYSLGRCLHQIFVC